MVSLSLQSDSSGYIQNYLTKVKQLPDSVRAPLLVAGDVVQEIAQKAGPVAMDVAVASQFPLLGLGAAISSMSYLLSTQTANALSDLALKFDSGPARLLVAPEAQNGFQDLLANQGDDKEEFNIPKLLERLEQAKKASVGDKGSIEILNKMLSALKKKQSEQPVTKKPNSTEVQITVETSSTEDTNKSKPAETEGPIITKGEFRKLFESFVEGTPYAKEYAKAKGDLNPTLSLSSSSKFLQDRLKEKGDIASKSEKTNREAFFKITDEIIGKA